MSGEGPPARRYSTGNTFLDRRIDGGIRAGSLVALVAPPGAQSQVLLRSMVRTRRTTYLSTVCPDHDELRQEYIPSDADASVAYAAPEDLLSDPDPLLDEVDPESYVVLDGIAALEREGPQSSVLSLLSALKRRLRDTDSVGVLHCQRDIGAGVPMATTLQRADTVWELTPSYGSRSLSYRLLVTKVRGGRALDEPIPLLLTDRVDIDTSWSI